MKFYKKKNQFFGGPGEAHVESRDTKVSRRPYHTGDILYVQLGKTMDNKCFKCENINIFGYLGAGGGGGGGFNNQTGPILFRIYPLFNNNLHVKYRSKGPIMLDPYIKSTSTRGTEMSANKDLITNNNLKLCSFSYMGQNVKKYIFWSLRGLQ